VCESDIHILAPSVGTEDSWVVKFSLYTTSSEPDINQVIKEARRTPFVLQIASLRIRDSRKLNLEPYNGLEDLKGYLAAFLIASRRVDLNEADEDAGYCKPFSENLCGQALMWFTQLESG